MTPVWPKVINLRADPANPGLSPNPTKAPWYFAGLQELLMHLHPVFSVCILPLIFGVALLAIHFLKEEIIMKRTYVRVLKMTIHCLLVVIMMSLIQLPAFAGSTAEIDKEVELALEKLYANSPTAQELSTVAKGILIFPDVIKAGLVIGGQYGEGALLVKGKTVGYYNTVAASYGLQAGAQSFGYAMFLMTDQALKYLQESSGWEIGVGPSIVVVDKGAAKSLTTSTAKEDIYAFFFGQEGLMAGLGFQGSKITKIDPDK